MTELFRVSTQDLRGNPHLCGEINKLLAQLSSPQRTTNLEELELVVSNPWLNMYLAGGTDSQLAAWISGMGIISFERCISRWDAVINEVVVSEKDRGCGLGSKIVNKLLNDARILARNQQTRVVVTLTSAPRRKQANELYIKLGFELVAAATGEHGTNLYKLTLNPE